MKLVAVQQSSGGQKTPAENILGFAVHFNAVSLGTEGSVAGAVAEYPAVLGLGAHRARCQQGPGRVSLPARRMPANWVSGIPFLHA